MYCVVINICGLLCIQGTLHFNLPVVHLYMKQNLHNIVIVMIVWKKIPTCYYKNRIKWRLFWILM